MKITNPARIQTKTEFLAMSNEDIITYCSEKEGNWKKVPRERINDKVISAMIQAQPKGVVALYSFKSDMHAQHVEAALLKWKSKALQLLRKADYPQDESFVCALIGEDPAYYRHLPRECKSPRIADAAMAADVKMYNETPSHLITEHHLLMVLEQAPELLVDSFKTPSCQLSPPTINKVLEIAPDFFTTSAMQKQLSKEQLTKLANMSCRFWHACSFSLPEVFDLMVETLSNPMPGKGAVHLKKMVDSAKTRKPHQLARSLEQASLEAPIYLMALDILDPLIFSRHVKALPSLMRYYQNIYGSEAAIALSSTLKNKRNVLERDLDL